MDREEEIKLMRKAEQFKKRIVVGMAIVLLAMVMLIGCTEASNVSYKTMFLDCLWNRWSFKRKRNYCN